MRKECVHLYRVPRIPRINLPRKSRSHLAADLATLIADKSSAKEALAAEIATLTYNLSALKAELKDKTAALKAIYKELAKLEAQKAEADAKAAEEVKKAELGEMTKKLIADGVSAAEILDKFNRVY